MTLLLLFRGTEGGGSEPPAEPPVQQRSGGIMPSKFHRKIPQLKNLKTAPKITRKYVIVKDVSGAVSTLAGFPIFSSIVSKYPIQLESKLRLEAIEKTALGTVAHNEHADPTSKISIIEEKEVKGKIRVITEAETVSKVPINAEFARDTLKRLYLLRKLRAKI